MFMFEIHYKLNMDVYNLFSKVSCFIVFFCFFYIFLILQSCLPNLPSLNVSASVIPFSQLC